MGMFSDGFKLVVASGSPEISALWALPRVPGISLLPLARSRQPSGLRRACPPARSSQQANKGKNTTKRIPAQKRGRLHN